MAISVKSDFGTSYASVEAMAAEIMSANEYLDGFAIQMLDALRQELEQVTEFIALLDHVGFMIETSKLALSADVPLNRDAQKLKAYKAELEAAIRQYE